ncbi:MAG: tetratricopeptide repeat protein [Candidatus Sulfotelmatobacter sp.]|jgi:hypothetical protein
MALPYREFAAYKLDDLAERTVTEHKDRITFSANHLSIQWPLPVRWKGEPEQQFAARLRDFRKQLPRQSDFSRRLALATEAFVRSGVTFTNAARLVHAELRKVPWLSGQQQARWSKLGIPHKRIPVKIGATRRWHRKKRKGKHCLSHDPEVETIRVQAASFKRDCVGFAQLFDFEFAMFRELFRDPDWYCEAERGCRDWMLRAEKQLGPCHQQTAEATLQLAELLHEQKKFSEAEELYDLALKRWTDAPSIGARQRESAMASILLNKQNCRQGDTTRTMIAVQAPAGSQMRVVLDAKSGDYQVQWTTTPTE